MEQGKQFNKKQAMALFNENAILIGGDAIPEKTVYNLFGAEAVRFVASIASGKKRPGEYRNGYTANGRTIGYVTYEGFLIAVTYHNVSIQQKIEEGDAMESQQREKLEIYKQVEKGIFDKS